MKVAGWKTTLIDSSGTFSANQRSITSPRSRAKRELAATTPILKVLAIIVPSASEISVCHWRIDAKPCSKAR
jgi:hypothetical protein